MGIFDLFKKKSSAADIGKEDLESQIHALDKLSTVFRNSPFLNAQGMGRSEKMASVLLSYKCIFAYFYGVVYDYGDPLPFFENNDSDDGLRFVLTTTAIENPATRGSILRELPSNWQDTLNLITQLRKAEPWEFDAMQNEIDGIGKSIGIFSRK